MGPDYLLAELRRAARSVLASGGTDAAAARDLAFHAHALDVHLAAGGEPPAAWTPPTRPT